MVKVCKPFSHATQACQGFVAWLSLCVAKTHLANSGLKSSALGGKDSLISMCLSKVLMILEGVIDGKNLVNNFVA